jgi:hypothetical protein
MVRFWKLISLHALIAYFLAIQTQATTFLEDVTLSVEQKEKLDKVNIRNRVVNSQDNESQKFRLKSLNV